MKVLLAFICALGLGFITNHAASTVNPVTALKADTVNHGGGCRKSSPPGMCCHKDHSTGTVHCH